MLQELPASALLAASDFSDFCIMPFYRRLLALPFLTLPFAALAAPDCPVPATPLDVTGVVAEALCRNPDTHSAWLNIQVQEARLKSAKSSYYPTLDATASQTHGFGDGGDSNRTSASLSANWLLYDFGARAANRQQAESVLAALRATQESSTQTVIQQAVDAYYQWYEADQALLAAQASEAAARETLKAAETRQRTGAGTLADVLQARTALSQASLSVIQRDGNREIARGTVAQALGLAAPSTVELAPPPEALPVDLQPPAFARQSTEQEKNRPDLRAQ
jgi:outer membrane protein TolC